MVLAEARRTITDLANDYRLFITHVSPRIACHHARKNMRAVDDVWEIDWYGIGSLGDHARILHEPVPKRPVLLSVRSNLGRSEQWPYTTADARQIGTYLIAAKGDDIRLPGVAWRWRCREPVATLLGHALVDMAAYEERNATK